MRTSAHRAHLPLLKRSSLFWGGMLLLCMLALPQEGGAVGRKGVPVGPVSGEHLVYNLRWTAVPAGEAFIDYTSPAKGRYEIKTLLRSIGMVRWMHPVEDVLEAKGTLSRKGIQTEYYLKSQIERKRKRRTESFYNRNDSTMDLVIDGGKEKYHLENISPKGNDPISAFFQLRFRKDLKPGATLSMEVVDGKKQYAAKITVGKAQQISTPIGFFNVIPVYPELKKSKLFRHRGAMIIWLTNDERRLPVRVETDVKIGHVAADLVEYKDGRGGSGKLEDSE